MKDEATGVIRGLFVSVVRRGCSPHVRRSVSVSGRRGIRRHPARAPESVGLASPKGEEATEGKGGSDLHRCYRQRQQDYARDDEASEKDGPHLIVRQNTPRFNARCRAFVVA